MRKNPKVIFDIGAHTGEDTDFYLNKGFKVIGVEANPSLCNGLRKRFHNFQQSGDFILYEKAIVEKELNKVIIYLNEEKDDWSSLLKAVASKDSFAVKEVEVDTVTLENLFKSHGTPCYLKVDIELYDINIARSLLLLKERPQFVSFEIHDHEILQILGQAGYKRFQIRNQLFNGFIKKPEATLEGVDYWPGPMGGFHSGLFGRDLPREDWRTFEETMDILNAYEILRPLDFLNFSWLDVHASID
jgi:FkbM family methyltransferase